LTGRVAVALRGVLQRTAADRVWTILELNVQPDHVHLLIQLGPDASVAAAVQALKGVSSLRLRQEFPALKAVLRQDALWAVGYFAESVGVVQDETIRRYIREQPEPDQSLP
jgi:putative transposase